MNDEPDIGDVQTELTLDHLVNLRDFVRRDADAPVEPRQDVCLLCHNFVGNHGEMYRHWLDDHGLDPAKALYGA